MEHFPVLQTVLDLHEVQAAGALASEQS